MNEQETEKLNEPTLEKSSETIEVKKEKKKHKFPWFNTIMVLILLFIPFSIFWNKTDGFGLLATNVELKEGEYRKMFYTSDTDIKEGNETIQEAIKEKDVNSSMTAQGISGNVSLSMSSGGNKYNKMSDFVKKNQFIYYVGGSLLSHPEDENIDYDEDSKFNQFVSQRNMLDTLGSQKLSDADLDVWSEKVTTTLHELHHPATYYMKDLIQNLKGKNPTLASIYYLLIANRVDADTVLTTFAGSNYNVEDWGNYFDRSYQQDKTPRYIIKHNTAGEAINKNAFLVHINVDGMIPDAAIMEGVNDANEMFAQGATLADTKHVHALVAGHYKDISNNLLAEYFIQTGNMQSKADKIASSVQSFGFKPVFAWGISPKIEEIASAYYDIVEPLVYKGQFTTMEDAFNQSAKALKNKYSLDEVKSAIYTYEFWAMY
ncbi:MAG: hypothetical protein RSA96_07555, partial [Erysipelotrichaceae bacterium]